MLYFDLSLNAPEENLASDEALCELSEAGAAAETLRFWEAPGYFVVLGYANKRAAEVNLDFCQRNGIPVLRRCSGGGTVLQGPGCLSYTLILSIDRVPSRQSITATNQEVLRKHQAALSPLVSSLVHQQGQTDLALGERKFSGNAQRRQKRFLLFHGTFLLNFDLDLIEKTLRMPSRQPDYRAHRSHTDFLMNLNVPAEQVKQALVEAWTAKPGRPCLREDRVQLLAREKYAQESWNAKF